MKKLSLLLILFSTWMNAQQPYQDYETHWKEVEQLEANNLPKSANEKVGEIYNKAKAANNSPQVIKCLLHQSKYALTLEEDAQLSIVKSFEKEIATTDFPTKNIMESTLASLYWQYFQQNRWQFYNRTNTAEKVDPADFRTWDLHTIFEEIHLHFQNSLQNGFLAQQTELKDFEAILSTQENSKIYRPTLYDFLAHNALEFYKTGESNLAQPDYKFEIENAALLGNNEVFSKVDLSSRDTLSQKRQALELYKTLTAFHQKNKNVKSLVDVSLNRLDFVRSNAKFNDKDAIYLQTLLALGEQYKKDEIYAEIAYRIGIEYQRLSQEYKPGINDKNQFILQDALAVCNNAIEQYPKSNGAKKCLNLKNTIIKPAISITNEKYIETHKQTRILVSYKNLDKLYFKIYKIASNVEESLQKKYNQAKKLEYIKKFQVETGFETILKNEKDYQNHTTEVIFPKLPQGHYLILASDDKDFNDDKSFFYSIIQTTDLALVESRIEGSYRYQVLDRFTGKPIVNASVNLRNKNTRYSNKPIDLTLVSDKNGFVKYIPKAHHNQVEITVKIGDKIGLFRYFRLYKPDASNRDREFQNNTVFLFTDRSIYRPAQTVYFKGIAVTQLENKSQVIADNDMVVTLTDVNYQEVGKLTLKTNEYGSFSGEFILPNSGLTGQYNISVQGIKTLKDKLFFTKNTNIYGNTTISVEEYKRPKFSTTFSDVKETFKLNDSVTVKGIATAYAGSNITDAKVVYRVKREVQYPRWWYWYRPWGYNSEAQEIAHGETTTNDKGEYEITFLAQPDKSVDKKDLPVFNYKITADITDINGETRSASKVVNVGYHSLMLRLDIDSKLDKDDKENKLKVVTKNLNGQFVPSKGTLKIYKVPAPKKTYRVRPWNAPDYQNIGQEEFESLFPHDIYKPHNQLFENDKKLGEPVYETSFDTKKGEEVLLKSMKKWASGKYIAVAETKDKFNQKVTDKAQFELFSNSDSNVSDKQLFEIKLNKDEYKPNERIALRLGSASDDMTVIVDIEKDHKVVRTELVNLSDGFKTIFIPVDEKDSGGFAINYYLVNYNSFERGSIVVNVPYPKTELEIETLTFRDKLQPGQEETWSFKIKGSKGDKVVAEILTSMYDASLDQFKTHQWHFSPIYNKFYHTASTSNAHNSFGNAAFVVHLKPIVYNSVDYQNYDALNWFGLSFGGSYYGMERSLRGRVSGVEINEMEASPGGRERVKYKGAKPAKGEVMMAPMIEDSMDGAVAVNGLIHEETVEQKEGDATESLDTDFSNVKIRTNFNETAFFFPQLTTDAEGNVSFSFTTPESLTKWKLQLLAHTKDLNTAVKSLETVTQKELMLLPNPPRFLREGDRIVISSKIANLTNKELNGMVELQLLDAITNKPIDKALGNITKTQAFSVAEKGNTNVSWELQIPETVQAVQYKIIAKAGDYSDGEQNVLPVLSNRMLVTETLPMWIRSNQTKTFVLDKLKNNTSTTLKNHKLTLEVTSNPAWYAVQALPYLMEYPYECAEQTFARYYANTLASHIANSNPRIQQVFNQWKNTDALLSNLEKNQELKSLIIQETPWLRDAQSETEQKNRIALLFDLHKMKSEQKKALRKLEQLQMPNGGFPWFKGSDRANRYITQHIVSGFGHLDKLNVSSSLSTNAQDKLVENDVMLNKALNYLDNEIKEDYRKLLERAKIIREREDDAEKGKKLEKEFLAKNNTSHFQIHYLYTRSFFKDIKIRSSVQKAVDYYTNQTYKYWNDYNLYSKGLISLVAYRNDQNAIADKILASLKENSITSEELGMYWKENSSSWYWYQAPIETQALLIEAFAEIEKDIETIDNLKIWLLKNKQTNRWKTTKATTEAVYALLLQGTDWLEVTDFVDIQVGGQTIDPFKLEHSKVEAGTGYFKTSWNGTEITPAMAEAIISKESEGIAWGAMYWQYFEDLDKITSAKTPLQLSKKLFLKTNEDRGEQLTEITDKTTLELGDLVRVRIELKVDRAMEFIHMKDMRASGFEPVNVISSYKWQDGLGYYESTKDASTNFFIDYLPKGVYVFEYDLRVNNAGDFSNGITTIQSMYAPEFSSHSEGVRVKIK